MKKHNSCSNESLGDIVITSIHLSVTLTSDLKSLLYFFPRQLIVDMSDCLKNVIVQSLVRSCNFKFWGLVFGVLMENHKCPCCYFI